jgi:uncharacterized RDD family membrane protein YckC
MSYGGFWVRLLAYLVDSVILSTAFGLLAIAAAFLGPVGITILAFLGIAGPVLYWSLMHASARQATFGKALLGLKVGDTSGRRVSLLRALAREVAKILSALPLMLGFILAAFTRRKQALHDVVASTTVVREAPGHLMVAIVIGLAGWLVPAAILMVFGTAALMGMMGMMLTGTMQEMATPLPQRQMQVETSGKPAAAPKVARSSPVPAPARAVADVETLFASRPTGIPIEPGTTFAGPALLELNKRMLFGRSFTVNVRLPDFQELQGNSVELVVASVRDDKGAELFDPENTFEKSELFRRTSMSRASQPEPHLTGSREVHLKSGTDAKTMAQASGIVKVRASLGARAARFGPGDAGKSQTVHGVEIVLKEVRGNGYQFEFKGDHARVAAVHGYGSDHKPVKIASWGGGGGLMKYDFTAPVTAVDVLVAEKLEERSFPFTLTRTSVAMAPQAAAQPVRSAPQPPVPAKSPDAGMGQAASAAKPIPQAAVPSVAPAFPSAAARPASVEHRAPAARGAPGPAPASMSPTPAVTPPSSPVRAAPKFNDLMTAVLYRDAAAVEELLSFGKWPDKPDSHGMTPLMAAAMLGEARMVELLLRAGANPEARSSNGDTALSLARARRHEEVITLLQRAGAR